jgi:hypothetical protein
MIPREQIPVNCFLDENGHFFSKKSVPFLSKKEPFEKLPILRKKPFCGNPFPILFHPTQTLFGTAY